MTYIANLFSYVCKNTLLSIKFRIIVIKNKSKIQETLMFANYVSYIEKGCLTLRLLNSSC